MTFRIPNTNKQIRQLNINDLMGEIYSSKNILLDRYGYIKLAHPSIAIQTTDDDSDFSYADSMFKSTDTLYVNSGHVFYGSIGFDTLTDRGTDTNVPSPSVEEDGVYFNSTEVISSGSNIYYRSASTTWTTVSLSLSTSHPTQMSVWDNKSSLVVGNNNIVKLIDTSWNTTYTLTLPSVYEVTSIDTNNDVCAIGTRHTVNGEAKLFIWDGSTTAYNGAYGCGAMEIPSVRKYKSSFVIVTSKGQLLQFSGSGFQELANFPSYYNNTLWSDASNDHSNISNRGMVVDGDEIYIRIDSDYANQLTGFNNYFQGGVWRYSPETGLNCIYTPSYSILSKQTIDTSNVNTTTDVITVSSAPITGTPFLYVNSSTLIGGMVQYKVYYTIKLTSTTIQVAETYSDAIAGTYIDLTGTGHSLQKLIFFKMNDYGWSYSGDRGSIEVLTNRIASYGQYNDKFIHSGILFGKQSQTSKGCLNIVSPLIPNNGYFITPKLFAPNITDIYDIFTIKYKPLKIDEKITIKYRTGERIGLPIKSIQNNNLTTGVWSDTNTFTTTLDLSNAQVGDEVEIVAGVGAGWTAHIESISESSGTYTVNLDDSFIYASANDIMYFVVDNWTKYKVITLNNEGGSSGYDSFNIDASGKFIQFKVELYGVDVTIEEIIISNSKSS